MTVNAEDEVSFAISDATGRSVMSGKLDNYKGTINNLVTWSCQVHDLTSNLAGYGTLLESRSIDGLGYATKQRSDGAGRTMRSVDQLDNATSFTYDAGGNQLSVRDPNNVGADMVYDALGRNTQRTDTFGDVTKSEYDRTGNAVKQIDAKNKNTLIAFDARGRRKSTTDRIGAVTTFAYTALGQLLSLTDAENQTTAYTFDSRGSKLTEQYPDHVANAVVGTSGYGIVTFVYDQAGRVLRKQDQAGDTCTYNYDLAGRMTSRNYRTAANSPSGTVADTDAFTFDRAGHMLTATSGRYANTVGYAYDPLGRKATESLTISGQTYTIVAEYNARNELVKHTYPDGSMADRSYHATGALNQLKLDSSTVSSRNYDNGCRLTSEVLDNGITETRTYRTDNLLSTISYSDANIGNLTYAWDANKNKTAESISGVMSGYGFTAAGTTYDFEDRLTGFQRAATSGPEQLTQVWSLTNVGDWSSVTTNGTSQTRTHGPTHELLTAGDQSVTTDVKGKTTTLPSNLTSNSSQLSLSYDFDNKLRAADVDNNGSVDVSFQYDALGRRVARVHPTGSLVYVQADQQTIADYGLGQLPSAPLYRYLYASYLDEPVIRKGVGTGGTVHYFHRNHLFSIMAITTDAGAIAERYSYTAYGQPTIINSLGSVISTSAISNRYSYTGREWDSQIQQYYYRARMYSPQIGRFCSRDPKWQRARDFGFYDYVHSRPLKFVDPSGLEDEDPCKPRLTKLDGGVIKEPRDYSYLNGVPFLAMVYIYGNNRFKVNATDSSFDGSARNTNTFLNGGPVLGGGYQSKATAKFNCIIGCNKNDIGACEINAVCLNDPVGGVSKNPDHPDDTSNGQSVAMVATEVSANGATLIINYEMQAFWTRDAWTITSVFGDFPVEIPIEVDRAYLFPRPEFERTMKGYGAWKCECKKKKK